MSVRSSPQHLYPMIVLLIFCSSALISFGSALTIAQGDTQLTFPEVAKGDPVTIRGNTTGQPPNGLTLWIIGNNYVKTLTVPVNGDKTFLSTIKSGDTEQLATGQYVVLVQDPGANGRFDIVYNANAGSVVNLMPSLVQVTYKANSNALGPTDEGTYDPVEDTVLTFQREGGTRIFQLITAGSLQRTGDSASLMNTLDSQNVDDIFATTSFSVGAPNAFVNPIPNHAAGDRFTIGGNTNLAAGDTLNVEITSFTPATKQQSGGFSGSSGRVTVVTGAGTYNCWTYGVDAAGYRPGDYRVKVSGTLQDVTGSGIFTILDHQPTPVTSVLPITSAQPVTTAPAETPAPLPTTQKSPLLPGVVAGGPALALLLARYRRGGD